jgi:phosphinothricin acetyltransferase
MRMPNVTIRDMTMEDWPAVARIYRQGVETGLARFERECPSFEAFDASHIKACRFVAVSEARVAGWIVLSRVSDRLPLSGVAEVSVYIGDEYRGIGIGKRLMLHLLEQSERAGYWTVQSSVFSDNAASLALHRSCGFRTVGYREKLGKDAWGRWRDTVLLERRSARFD